MGVYLYIGVLPDEFLLKSVVIRVDCKGNSSGRTLIYEYTLPPINGQVMSMLCCAVLCCPVLCCAVLCCPVLCCPVLCCAVLWEEHGQVWWKLFC